MPTHLSLLRHRFAILGFAWLALLVAPVAAWNALGHKTIAEIAWQQLDPAQRQAIVDVLRRHPRFDRDFADKMADDAMKGDKADQDHWIFLQAATWPDIIRKTEDDRPSWHYVDFPIFLAPSDEQALANKLTFNRSADYPTRIKPADMNVMQAVQHAQAAIRADNAGPDVKAIAYCWLFHLVGDLHQPLHSTALVSVNQFPTGDRGGNEILITRGKNLHSLWDGLLGNGTKLNDVKKAAYDLSDKTKYGDVWRTAYHETDLRNWVAESHELCESFVYSPEILQAVRNTPQGEKMAPAEISQSYLQSAGNLARRRVLLAGLRLGKLLPEIAGPTP